MEGQWPPLKCDFTESVHQEADVNQAQRLDVSLTVKQFLLSFPVVQETLKYDVGYFSLPPNCGEIRSSEGGVLPSMTYFHKSVVF